MELEAFLKLGQQSQLDAAVDRGVYLMHYSKYNVVVRLFQVDRFYAEVYSRSDDGEVIMVHAFEDTHYLEPYLEKLVLPALF